MSRDLLPPTTDQSLALRAMDILRRRQVLALVVFGAVLAAAATFALYLPDLYKATAMVVVLPLLFAREMFCRARLPHRRGARPDGPADELLVPVLLTELAAERFQFLASPD